MYTVKPLAENAQNDLTLYKDPLNCHVVFNHCCGSSDLVVTIQYFFFNFFPKNQELIHMATR